MTVDRPTSVPTAPVASQRDDAPSRGPVIVIAPDSFKGSLDAAGVARAIGAGIRQVVPTALIRELPLADGGEGTLDALCSRGAQRLTREARDAAGRPRATPLGRFDDGAWVLETASVVGLTDPASLAVPLEARASWGLGDLLRAADAGGDARDVYVALGGSASNDGGAGLLTALGLRLFDEAGELLAPTPEGLSRLARVDASQLWRPRSPHWRLIGLSDVDNPLLGERGASAVFGPQKGARDVDALDRTLARFADCLEAALDRQVRDVPGAGAAGGLGFALLMLGGTLAPGAERLADRLGLEQALQGADWLITGEGRSDRQTLGGKAPLVVARRARALGVPASLLSGGIDPEALAALAPHFDGCFSPVPGPMTLSDAIGQAEGLLRGAAEQMARLRWPQAAAQPGGQRPHSAP